MRKQLTGFIILYFSINLFSFSQVDTAYIFNTQVPYGALDIRIAKSPTDYFYLQEGKTFSFRESPPGVKTNTYLDMTSWDSSPYTEGNLREKAPSGDYFVMNYRLLMPENYDASFREGYPIVMVLHGYGERGNCEEDNCYHADRDYWPVFNDPPAPTDADSRLLNNDHNLLHGGREHLAAVHAAGGKLPNDATLDDRAFPGFVLFPQNLNGWDNFSSQDAIRILRLVMKKYNINPDRVYIEGISNGGQGMFECLKRAPWLFAAAIGMSPVNDGFINVQGVAGSVAHIPLWIFQGGQDDGPFPGTTMRYIKGFESAGATVRYTLYPEIGHSTWNQAFREPDFFSFMLGKNKADLHSFEGSTFICSDEGTRLEVAKGFLAYQWEFNGSVIAGADSAVFYAKNPGKYRVRFARVSNPSEGDWNQWSDPITLTVTDPPLANLEQVGTVLLKDLNGFPDAVLQSAEPHTHYYWYRDGKLLDLPGQEDDTAMVVTLTPSYGQGAYSLVVADFGCRSKPSEAKHVFFNDGAPVNLPAPKAFEGFSSSPSENTLAWKDASSAEDGFEIWRREKTAEGAFSPWEMAALTAPNITAFDDKDLDPMGVYQYKIRAVSNSGRSDYVPGGAEGLSVTTLVDDEMPEGPTDLKVVQQGVQHLFLSWKPSTDNTGILEYYVYFNDDSVSTGTADSTFLLTTIPPNRFYDITVKGVDLAHNISAPSNTVKASTYFSGLYYEHTTGSWTTLDSIDWSWSESHGKVRTFTLKHRSQDDYFNFSFEGFLFLENGGNYQFRTSSNDGSNLRLDNRLLVDNDGVHEYKTVTSGTVALKEGAHRIRVEFFDYIETDSLRVEYKGPDTGNQWTDISREVLKSDESVVTAIGPDPDNGPEDSFGVSVYPNPARPEDLHVMVETVIPTPVRVRLFDPLGRSLFEAVYSPGDISRGVTLSPSRRMDDGLYVVIVSQGRVQVQRKVVISR